MQIPLQIRFHGTDRSPAVEAKVREHVDKLEKFSSHIIGCRVSLEALHQHHQQGNLFSAKVWITVPDGEIAVTRDAGRDHRHEDPYIALHDAFRAARRQLEDYQRNRRGDVKHHEPQESGRIGALNSKTGWGTILTPDGREIGFHRNSLVDAKFADIAPGMKVRFVETAGEDGPVATTVHVAGGQRAGG